MLDMSREINFESFINGRTMMIKSKLQPKQLILPGQDFRGIQFMDLETEEFKGSLTRLRNRRNQEFRNCFDWNQPKIRQFRSFDRSDKRQPENDQNQGK